MPAHSHAIQGTLQAQFQVSTDQGSQQAPSAGALISVGYYKTGASHFVESYVPSGSPSTSMGGLSTTMTGSVDSAGTGSAHGNMQPWAVLNYMIAVVGIFPSPNN
jgi:microcystin-dependent protein